MATLYMQKGAKNAVSFSSIALTLMMLAENFLFQIEEDKFFFVMTPNTYLYVY